MDKRKYIVVAGPTASGKSSLAIDLATRLGGEVVNCDSIQVYQELNIGSAKPSAEEMAQVAHHLFDIIKPDQEFDANKFATLGRLTIAEIISRGKIPIVVGGTGLYLRALWGQNFNALPKSESLRKKLSQLSSNELLGILEDKAPRRKSQVHPNDRFRLQRAAELALLVGDVSASPQNEDTSAEAFKIYCKVDRGCLHQKIEARTEKMLAAGLVDEVKNLLKKYPPHTKPLQSIGYRQVVDYLSGKLEHGNLANIIATATRQYAKRQETWFRKVSFDFYYKAAIELDTLISCIDCKESSN